MIEGKMDWEFAEEWYNVDDIERAINTTVNVPVDVASREFAEWLARQYRLAMCKGMQLARGEQA